MSDDPKTESRRFINLDKAFVRMYRILEKIEAIDRKAEKHWQDWNEQMVVLTRRIEAELAANSQSKIPEQQQKIAVGGNRSSRRGSRKADQWRRGTLRKKGD